MESGLPPSDQGTQNLNNDALWKELYPLLQSLTRRLVGSFAVSNWRGQEYDVAEDIVQETAYRILEHMQKVKRGEAEPVHSLEGWIAVVAQNRCRDSIRRDHRMVRLTLEEFYSAMRKAQTNNSLPLEVAIENVEREKCFRLVAQLVTRFPRKQREALLIDLANRMHFDTELTPLQKAFLDAGIQLKDYQRPLSTNPVERARHSSLLYQAYKRVNDLCSVDDED